MGIKDYSVVDLFCGVGGLSHGFLNEGFNIAAGIDYDLDCQYAYETNNHTRFIHDDIATISSKKIEATFTVGKKKILIGCAPCQPFSIFNKKNKGQISSTNSERWKLLYAFAEIIKRTRPTIISMENVPLLKSFRNGEVFNDFVRTLEESNYFINYEIIDSQLYGVPQRRKRLVLLGSLLGEIEMIKPTHQNKSVSVKQAIANLPPIEAGEISKEDSLHRARMLNELGMKRIKATPEGGSWKDWKEDLIADCHKREGGRAFGSAYGRMSWNDVAPTMTTYCTGYSNGRFGHPEQNRAISLREAALIQSFPKSYDFINPNVKFSAGRIAKQIGNAVPVMLGQAIAKSIAVHIEKYKNVNFN